MGRNKRPIRKSGRPIGVLVTMLLAAAVVAGLAYYVKNGPGRFVPDDLKRPFDHVMTGRPEERAAMPQMAKVMVPKPVVAEDGSVRFETEQVDVAQGEDPKVAAINGFLFVSGIADPNAKALGVDVSDGTARIDFNEAFESGQGSFDEAVLIKGFRAALGQFPEVMRIELYVSGKRIPDLGHLDLTEPQVVIRPNDWNPKPSAAPPPAQTR